MNLRGVGRAASSFVRIAAGRRGRWVAGLAVALALGFFLHLRISRIPFSRVSSLEFLVGGAVVALGCVFSVLPVVLVRPHPELRREQLLKARNDVRTAGIQILGGAILLAGLLFTNRTLELNRQGQELSRQGQITDRFTKATDQLGSDKLDIRLGGIYALERVARDSQADQGPVMEVLTAFVREHAPISQTGAASATTTVSTDVQAVLTVVGRRKVSNDPRGLFHLDLSHTKLTGADLSQADLSQADLRQADLSHAGLLEANLFGANLFGANLSGASLGGILTAADLSHANLTGADFTGADLSQADLSQADLSYATGLTQAEIDSATTDGTTKLPAGLKPHN